MRFFIDEAGDFAIPGTAAEHRVAVAAAVAFSDRGWESIGPKYASFRSELASVELRSGEPRWHLLTRSHREQFLGLLRHDEGVSITPVTLDLSHLVGVDWLKKMLDRLRREPSLMVYDTAKAQMETLYRQVVNLSAVQQLRIYSWAYCVHQALYHAILFLGNGPDDSSWETVRIEIDAVQRAAGAREERVFRLMLLAWLAGWSKAEPFVTIKDLHTREHPFIKNYDTNGGVDLGKLVRPNLSWGVSAQSDGLQIADLVAGAVYRGSGRSERCGRR